FSPGDNGDGGPAAAAKLAYVDGVAYDAAGNLYIASSQENRVRKVDAVTGNISTFAGTGVGGTSGDSGPANAAQVEYVSDVAVDRTRNILYIAHRYNGSIGAVDLVTGIITTVVGDGTNDGVYVDGQAGTSVKLGNNTGGLFVDEATGDL